MIKPISPSEVKKHIPDFVIKSINELIQENLSSTGKKSSFTLKELKTRIKFNNQEKLVEDSWLEFESLYENAGWSIFYFSPDFGDSFDSYYEFYVKK